MPADPLGIPDFTSPVRRTHGPSFEVGRGELPPAARFLQVTLLELHHDLTRRAHARSNEGCPAS